MSLPEPSPYEAYSQVLRFASQRGELALRLALHAGMPQVLRPELLHLLRLNFLPEALDDVALEADVLFAEFCEDLGNGYYRFQPHARANLLSHLDPTYEDSRIPRSRQVAAFLARYVGEQLHSVSSAGDPLYAGHLELEYWNALAFLDEQAAAEQLAEAVAAAASKPEQVAARVRLTGLASTLATPLVGYQRLLAYAAGLEALQTGATERAQEVLEGLGDGELTVGRVTLRSPRAMLRAVVEEGAKPGRDRESAPRAARPSEPAPLPPHRIFISHTSDPRNRDLIDRLFVLCREQQLELWEHHRGSLLPGEHWLSELDQDLRQATHAVVLLTPAFEQSEYAQFEVRSLAARRPNVVILPFLLNGRTVPHVDLRDLHHTRLAGTGRDATERADELAQRIRNEVTRVIARPPASPRRAGEPVASVKDELEELEGLGVAYVEAEDFEAAEHQFRTGLALAKREKDEACFLARLGHLYERMGRLEEALQCSERALALFRRTDNPRGQAQVLQQAGHINLSMGRPRIALLNFTDVAALRRTLGDRPGELEALAALSKTYVSLADLEMAEAHDQKRLALARELGDRRAEAEALGDVGNLCFEQRRHSDALMYSEASLDILQALDDLRGQAVALQRIAAVHSDAGAHGPAFRALAKALALARSTDDRRLADAISARIAEVPQPVRAREGARSNDVGELDGRPLNELPPSETVLALDLRRFSSAGEALSDEDLAIARLIDGRRTIDEIIADSDRGSVEAMRALQRMLSRDLLIANTERPSYPQRTIRIFLASSAELSEDRARFELHFRRYNDQLRRRGIHLEIICWESSLDALAERRLQDEYNRAVEASDVFVSLFFTKAGKFIHEELDAAYRGFLSKGKPRIYVYFKIADLKLSSLREEDMKSLRGFEGLLNKLGHYPTKYENIDQLLPHFQGQLDHLLD